MLVLTTRRARRINSTRRSNNRLPLRDECASLARIRSRSRRATLGETRTRVLTVCNRARIYRDRERCGCARGANRSAALPPASVFASEFPSRFRSRFPTLVAMQRARSIERPLDSHPPVSLMVFRLFIPPSFLLCGSSLRVKPAARVTHRDNGVLNVTENARSTRNLKEEIANDFFLHYRLAVTVVVRAPDYRVSPSYFR